MTTYRQARPDERNEYIDLANYTFGFDIEALLPKVYDSGFDSAAITKVAETDGENLLRKQPFCPDCSCRRHGAPHKFSGDYGCTSKIPRRRSYESNHKCVAEGNAR